MAAFSNKNFTKNDEWTTPKENWAELEKYLPEKLKYILIDPFVNDENKDNIHKIYTDLGYASIHPTEDFFDFNLQEKIDQYTFEGGKTRLVLVSNPPYSCLDKILSKLEKYEDFSWALLIPITKITNKYFRDTFGNEVKVIIPKRRFKYGNSKSHPPFHSVLVCYGDAFNHIAEDIVWCM